MHLVSLAKLAERVVLEPKDPPVHEDPRERKVIRGLERWEIQDHQERQVSQVPQATVRWDPQDLLGSRAFLASQAPLDSLVRRGMMAGVIPVTV